MRKIKKINSNYADILVIDSIGSENLAYCVPENITSKVLVTRNEIPLILSIKFFIILVTMIAKFGFTPMALISSIVKCIKPKVVLTFTDNISIMGRLADLFPICKIISVQNGVRFKWGWDSNYTLPIYFGFGRYESELIKNRCVSVLEYKPIGSLKMGIYLSEHFKDIKKLHAKNKICFISQYRHNMLDSELKPWYSKFTGYSKEIFADIVKWSEVNNYEVSVVMANGEFDKDFNHELTYFKQTVDCSMVKFYPNVRKKFSSYKRCIDSNILVTMDSTLGFEMFGYGKKILFCGAMNDYFANIRGSVELFERVPEFAMLREVESEIKPLSDKLLFLSKMTNVEYLRSTESARLFYMDFGPSYPHDIISNYISNFLDKKV
jgi:surface carbohydrate biosynthesis protein